MKLHAEYRRLWADLPLCLHQRSPRKHQEPAASCSNPNINNALQQESELYLCKVFGFSATRSKRPLQFLTPTVRLGLNVIKV